MKYFAGVFGAVAACVLTARGGVFDDAMAWWKFDQGGADGARATAGEIHDVRDASRNQPSTLYGAQGGPLWSVMDVRLPYQRRTVRGTALHFPCDTRMNGTTPQCYYTSLAFSGLQNHGSELTVVARVRFESNGVGAADTILWNNAFGWGSNAGSALGFIKGNAGQRGAITTYVPYAFVGQNNFGNAPADKTIPMKVGEWYDVAFLLSEDVVDGTCYDVVTFVVADVASVRTHTVRKASKRNAGATTAHARMGCMNYHTDWVNYDASISKNSSDNYKNFDGWIHQLAVWNRRLTLDEVTEAFGRPAEHPEQDVYAEASNWIRFDRDLNGDGKVQADEVRDLRHWNRPQDGLVHVVSQSGPQGGGPVWTNMTVDLPGRGVSITSPCLYFPVATNISLNASGETEYSAWPSSLRLGNTVRAGSYTVMARIYPLAYKGVAAGVNSFFYNNGLDWGSWAGSEFGIGAADATGNKFFPRFILSRATYEAKELDMQTNTWYDIAISVADNGFDETGAARTDSALVAVQDVQHGFRYKVLNVGTNALTSFATWNGACVLGGEGFYNGLTGFWNETTKKQISYGNAVKTFHGVIHELAVWNRALTTNEIAAAFSHPNNMVMGVGTADGANGEFAGTEGVYDCTVDAAGLAWRDIAGTLDADHPELTLRFTPDANNVGLVHYLHVKAAEVGVSAGEQARISLRLNGRTLASAKDVGAYDDLWCVVSRKALRTGENELKIAYAGGTAATFKLDSAEIVGSWQLGKADNGAGEFTQEGTDRSAPNFTVGNRRLKHVVRAVTGGWKNNYIHFYMPAEIAAKHAFTFTSSMCDQSTDANHENRFSIYLNDVEKFATPTDRKLNKPEPIAFEVEPGELKPGWNTIHTQWTSAKSGWTTFDFFRLAISDYYPGTFFFFR